MKKQKLPIVDPKTPFKYISGNVPKSYACGNCGAHGVKLWRDYMTFLDQIVLRCAKCAGKNQKRSTSIMTSDGKVQDKKHKYWTDQIGSLMPAIPTEQNDTYWGYTSVPENGCIWWRKLPNN